MKWLSARLVKWLLAVTLMVLLPALVVYYSNAKETSFKTTYERNFNQIGLYDLKSQQKEIYDTHLQPINGALQITLTSPDDNRFIIKGKIEQNIDLKTRQITYSYTQTHYTSPQKGLMIDDKIDRLVRKGLQKSRLKVNGKIIVMTTDGMIFPIESYFPYPLD